MKLYAGGAEVPGWRRLLAEERFPSVSLSFVGLSRRIKHLDAWKLADKFPADPGFRQDLFVDSGAYSLNREDADYSDEQALELFDAYLVFVTANLDRIDVVSEFDALQLGAAERNRMRSVLSQVAGDKFMPIWHPEDSTQLELLADAFQRVGVKQPEKEAMDDLTPVLRRIAGKTKLHGVAMTRMGVMREIPWDSVGSTSWLSPGRNGDTIIWTGHDLHRYPMKYKNQARQRHRTTIADAGFDPVAVARDATEQGTPEDRKEVLRLSLWSWGKFVEDINRHDDTADAPRPSRGAPRMNTPAVKRKTMLLPILDVFPVIGEDGAEEPQVDISGSNLMQCNTCFARDKCPQFQPDADCAYEIPMVIKTTTQARALRKALLAMQAQRVFRMNMFEQLEGGMVLADLTREMTLLNKMLEADANADREGFTLEIKATGDGQLGFMNRMFGRDVEQRVNAIEPVDTNLALETIFEGEVIER